MSCMHSSCMASLVRCSAWHRRVIHAQYRSLAGLWLVFQRVGFVHVGRSSLADDILSNKFTEISPIFGSKIEGKDKFKSIIDGLYSVSLAASSFCLKVCSTNCA